MSLDKSVKSLTIKTFKKMIVGIYGKINENFTPNQEAVNSAMLLDSKWIKDYNKELKLVKKQAKEKSIEYVKPIKTPPQHLLQLENMYDKMRSKAIKKLQAFYLHGSPGIGKSDAIKQLAGELDINFRDIRLTTLDPVDLRGLPMIDKENMVARWLQAGFLPKAHEKNGVLFIDEINAVPPSMQAAAYQLVLDKEIGEYKLPDGWIVIVAGNKMTDRAVTHRLPSPLANRFTHVELEVNVQEWVEWAEDNKIDIYVLNFIRLGLQGVDSDLFTEKVQSVLFNFTQKNALAFPTPRSWFFVSNLSYLRDIDTALYLDAITGTVGVKAGDMFFQFMMHRDTIPNIEDILNGKSYEMPNELDTQYVMNSAILEALERETTTKRLDNYVTNYITWFENKYKKDMVAIIIKDLMNRFDATYNKTLLSGSKEFTKLLERNSSIFYG